MKDWKDILYEECKDEPLPSIFIEEDALTFKNKDKMKTIKRIIKQVKESKNLKPYKVVRLSTGVICEHYSNGNVKVL